MFTSPAARPLIKIFMKNILLLFFFLVLGLQTLFAGMPDFGPDGLSGLTKAQKQDLDKGKIVFSTTNSGEQAQSTLIEAAVVFDVTPQETWRLLSKTEDQIKYLKEIDELNIIKTEPTLNIQEFKLKIAFLTIVYRVIHRFDESNQYIYWGLDPSFNNDLEDLRGFWRFYPYGQGKTLARYGSNVSIKNIPDWIEAIFKKSGVKKSLLAVKKYVDSGELMGKHKKGRDYGKTENYQNPYQKHTCFHR